MQRILKVAQREYIETAKTKTFIIGLLMTPVIIGAIIFFTSRFSGSKAGPRPPINVAITDLSKQLAEDLGLKENIYFLGFRKDVDNIYADSDALIFPSLTEGAPFAIIEALASARPVVATDVGGISELIDEGKCGFVVPAKDPKALTEALLKLIRDEGLRKSFGENARSKVYPSLSHNRLVKDMEKLYLQLVNSSRNGV